MKASFFADDDDDDDGDYLPKRSLQTTAATKGYVSSPPIPLRRSAIWCMVLHPPKDYDGLEKRVIGYEPCLTRF